MTLNRKVVALGEERHPACQLPNAMMLLYTPTQIDSVTLNLFQGLLARNNLQAGIKLKDSMAPS